MRVTICPPSPQLEKFDHFQFDGRRSRVVSADSRIAWSDYERMGTKGSSVSSRPARWIPPFASDKQKLCAVILEYEKRNARHKYDDSSSEVTKHREAVARCGGFRPYVAAIIYRAWFERLDCVTIAQMMEINPGSVRQTLWRIQRVARDLGFETVKGVSAGKGHKQPRLALEARRRTIRRRLFGKPEYVEGFHCFSCRIALIDKETNKWRCKNCNEKNKQKARIWFRKKHGMSLRRKRIRRAA